MSSLDDHPTVRRLRAGGAQESTVEQNPLNSGSLRRIALECVADDCGLVRIDDPALGEERDHVLRAFPGTRTLLAIVRRMHRGPVRSPARSLANLEFHRAGILALLGRGRSRHSEPAPSRFVHGPPHHSSWPNHPQTHNAKSHVPATTPKRQPALSRSANGGI